MAGVKEQACASRKAPSRGTSCLRRVIPEGGIHLIVGPVAALPELGVGDALAVAIHLQDVDVVESVDRAARRSSEPPLPITFRKHWSSAGQDLTSPASGGGFPPVNLRMQCLPRSLRFSTIKAN
jgi:hypothetical protein